MIVPSNMDQDSHGDHDSGYHDGNWSHMHSYNPSPMSAFESEYYSQSGGQPLSMESFNMQMAPPPPPALRPQPQNVYSTQLPHGLLIPSHQTSQVPWPSLQTNPSRSFGTPPIPIPPASAPPRIAQTKLPSTATTGPRKTLTIEDRRAMCKYAEENPHVKQTEIGARFGVERSTVSKTLRNKDKFLSKTEETSSSPTQRTKGKGPPDIERTLASWVKSAQKTGAPINDADLEERARFFCAGAHCDGSKLITRAWIEKFKQKHGIGPRRRASETALSDTRYKNQPTLLAASSMTASGTTSPISPKTKASSVVPISNADLRSSLSISMDFESSNGKQPLPQSATPLPSATSEPASASFSSSAISPTSAYTFSPNLTGGLFDGLGPGQHRHRSQTLPNIDPLEYIDQSQAMDTLTPRLNNCVTGPSSAMTSPAHELATNPFAFESAISTPILRHVSSNSSLTGRSTASAAVSGTPISGPNSPTQDDARRAADVLLSYIQSLAAPGLVDQQDYEVVVRLTDKLRLHQHSQMMQQQSLPNKMNMTGQGLGILSRIPEGDAEIMHSPLTHLEN